jgi:hypothetical protein
VTNDKRSPFERLLGSTLEQLPPSVRHVHSSRARLAMVGSADITAASGLCPLIFWIAGLPRAGRDVDVRVVSEQKENGVEYWNRKFADRRYTSTIEAGTGRDQGFLIEHFGLFDFRFHLNVLPQGLAWTLIGWRCLRVPLPRWSVPRIKRLESADGDRYTFDIDVAFPWIGRLIHYQGWLVPQHDDTSDRPPPRSA